MTTFEQIVNSGLDRAEVVSYGEDEEVRILYIKDLTSNDTYVEYQWNKNPMGQWTEEQLAYICLREVNEYLEELRSED